MPHSDIKWFACDCDDHVAYFTSMAEGCVPPLAYTANSQRPDPLCFFKQQISSSISIRMLHPMELPSIYNYNKWYRQFNFMSRRGLYTYFPPLKDVGHTGYCMVTKPEIPILLNDIPNEIQASITLVRLKLCFAVTPFILVNEICPDLDDFSSDIF
jgi:hypothetical protein